MQDNLDREQSGAVMMGALQSCASLKLLGAVHTSTADEVISMPYALRKKRHFWVI